MMKTTRKMRTSIAFMIPVALCNISFGAVQSRSLPCGLTVDRVFDSQCELGKPFRCEFTIGNPTDSDFTYALSANLQQIDYRGVLYEGCASLFQTNAISSRTTNTVLFSVEPSIYKDWTKTHLTYEMNNGVEVLGQGDENWWIDFVKRGEFVAPTNFLSVSTTNILVGSSVTGMVSLLNPMPFPIHNVKVRIFSDIRPWNDPTSEQVSVISVVSSNNVISAEASFTAIEAGLFEIAASIQCDEFSITEPDRRDVDVLSP